MKYPEGIFIERATVAERLYQVAVYIEVFILECTEARGCRASHLGIIIVKQQIKGFFRPAAPLRKNDIRGSNLSNTEALTGTSMQGFVDKISCVLVCGCRSGMAE